VWNRTMAARATERLTGAPSIPHIGHSEGEETTVMARETERLTTAKVKALAKTPTWGGKPPRRKMYADGNGLYLMIRRDGARSWVLRYRLGEGQHEHGLGSLSLVGLAEARERALAARRKVRLDGVNPIAEEAAARVAAKVEAASSRTFAETAGEYLKAHSDKWSDKHASGYATLLERHAFPSLGALPVASIDRALVLGTLEPIWRVKIETASRLQRLVKSVLDFAAVKGYRPEGVPNPADWAALKHVLPAPGEIKQERHHAALPYNRMGEVMGQIRALSSPSARALEFTILTAVRAGEARGMAWGEVDLDAKVWTIPAERMKAVKEHRVPLSDSTLAILQTLGPGEANGRVFEIGENGMRDTLHRIDPAISVHGFRSTFRDWAGDRTAYAREVTEAALAHAVGNATEQAYRRESALDKRRQLMQEWARYCGQVAPVGAEVVPIRA
jgi:integrase